MQRQGQNRQKAASTDASAGVVRDFRDRWLRQGPLWVSLSCCLLAYGALAQVGPEASQDPDPAADSGALVVSGRPATDSPRGSSPGIDSLLQLPQGFMTTTPRAVAGVSESEWRRRFSTAISAVETAQATLEATKQELDGVAGGGSSSQWSMAPPGGGGDASLATSPLSFKLRQQLRENRERVETTEKAMRELRIEADLAGVPESWRNASEGTTPVAPN